MNFKPLNSVAKVIAGQSPPSKFYNSDGNGFPFFQGKADFGELHPQVRVWCSKPKKIAEPGDILISVRAPVGPTNLADQPCCIGRGLSAIRVSNILHVNFLLHYFRFIEPELSSKGRGSTFSAITQKDLRNLQVPVPPLSEQRRIAAILDKADELRAKRRAALDKLDRLLQSIFLDMFGDPVTNSKGWHIKPLADVLCGSPQNGAYYPKDQYTTSQDEGIEMVHMSDAFYGIVRRGSLKRVLISESDIEKYRLAHNDLLIARRSLNYEGAAKPCRIPQSNTPLIFESSLIRITPDPQIVRPIYLYHYLSNKRARQTYVYPNVTRSTISGINQAGLKRIKILIPSLDAQLNFEKATKKIETQQKNMLFMQIKQEKLFHALQQRAFRGELTANSLSEKKF